jgi:hypothetical protein
MRARVSSRGETPGAPKLRRLSISMLAVVAMVGAMFAATVGAASAATPTSFFNGFETDTSAWVTPGPSLTRENASYASAYASLVAPATGSYDARLHTSGCTLNCDGPFTRFGGYSTTFPTGGYTTSLSVYLDTAWAASHDDARFDWDVSSNNNTSLGGAGFLRDFAFNVATESNGGQGRFVISAGNNALRSGTNPHIAGNKQYITTSGWYTFVHHFIDGGANGLQANMSILNSSHTLAVPSWTITSGDAMSTVGGNHYGWFANQEIDGLLIDDQALILADTTGPSITCGSADSSWHATDQSVTCTASDDGGSGLADPTQSSISLTTSVASGTETDNAATSSVQVCDNASNCTAAGPVSGWHIDKKAPTGIAFSSALSGTYYSNSVPASPTCSANDGGSGLPASGGCVVTGYSTAPGAHTLTATATDNVGNSGTATANYTVVANWALNGFFQPVDMGNVVNTVKNGSTVPLKFRIFNGTTELTNTSAVTSLIAASYACDQTSPTDAIEQVATGGTSLRYDTTAQQFVYNWQTPKSAGACVKVTVTTQDGSTIQALFKLK